MSYLKEKLKQLLFFITFFNIMCLTTMAQETEIDYGRLINAIGMVESKMNDNARSGVHAGFLQISKITVNECNRINKIRKNPTRYTYNDRFNHQKSIEMFYIIQTFYNRSGDFDYAILLWNEGNSAMKKPKRKTKYYLKVMKELKKEK